MGAYGITGIEIYGHNFQETNSIIRKSEVLKKLFDGMSLAKSLVVDDMVSQVNDLATVKGLGVNHADWGYDKQVTPFTKCDMDTLAIIRDLILND